MKYNLNLINAKDIYFIVYMLTNLVNSKFYIGIHATYNLNDNYMGSGKIIKRAIKKYGINNFKKDIIHFCYNYEHMREIERQIVDKNFIKRKDTYNSQIGGVGRYGPENPEKFKMKRSIQSIGDKNNASKAKMSQDKINQKAKKWQKQGRKIKLVMVLQMTSINHIEYKQPLYNLLFLLKNIFD